MSNFFNEIDKGLGDENSLSDIRLVVRRCWFFDFLDNPVRLWQGQGKLHTSDGNTWLGTIDSNGTDYHDVPAIQDGRDGSSALYNFTLQIPTWMDQSPLELYDLLKSEQSLIKGRKLTSYLILFKLNEGLRPETPITFFTELNMISTKFNEELIQGSGGSIVNKYTVTLLCKDGNFGRSNRPNGTYSDGIQKERAKQLTGNVNFIDKGSEFLSKLANRTYQLP